MFHHLRWSFGESATLVCSRLILTQSLYCFCISIIHTACWEKKRIFRSWQGWCGNYQPKFCLLCDSFSPLKPKLVFITFKNSVRTSKRTPYFTITKINWLMLFKEIIHVHIESHTKLINTKSSVTNCQRRWYIYLPIGFKGLKLTAV
jgi:hypothetical protein